MIEFTFSTFFTENYFTTCIYHSYSAFFANVASGIVCHFSANLSQPHWTIAFPVFTRITHLPEASW